MIADKITPELKQRFKEAILETRKDGIERGFNICLNKKLFAGKTCEGSKCGITLPKPKGECPDKVQGDFHTHPTLYFFKEELRDVYLPDNVLPPDNILIRSLDGDIKEKGLTPQTPSHGDILFGLNMKFFGMSKGTTCIGADYDDTKVECWTPKKVSHDEYIRANYELVKGGPETGEPPKKWARSLFEKEIIKINQ